MERFVSKLLQLSRSKYEGNLIRDWQKKMKEGTHVKCFMQQKLMAWLLCALCKGEQERKASSFQGFSSQVFFFYWRHTSLKGDCPAPSPPALWRPGKLAAASQTASQLQFHLGLRFWQWRALLLVTQSFLTLCKPHGLQPTRLLCPRNFPVKNTGEGSHSLLQGIFLTQGSKPSLLQCKQILYKLRPQASPNAFLGD